MIIAFWLVFIPFVISIIYLIVKQRREKRLDNREVYAKTDEVQTESEKPQKKVDVIKPLRPSNWTFWRVVRWTLLLVVIAYGGMWLANFNLPGMSTIQNVVDDGLSTANELFNVQDRSKAPFYDDVTQIGYVFCSQGWDETKPKGLNRIGPVLHEGAVTLFRVEDRLEILLADKDQYYCKTKFANYIDEDGINWKTWSRHTVCPNSPQSVSGIWKWNDSAELGRDSVENRNLSGMYFGNFKDPKFKRIQREFKLIDCTQKGVPCDCSSF